MKDQEAISTIKEVSENVAIEEKGTFTAKVNVGDFVQYTGDGDEETNDWRVWQKNDTHVIITPVLNYYSRQLILDGSAASYLDIAKNARNQTDRINKACKRWYSNARLGVSADDIRSMTKEDIDEICGYIPPKKVLQYIYRSTEVEPADSRGDLYWYHPNEVEEYEYYPDKVKRDVRNIPKMLLWGKGYTEPRFYAWDKGGAEKIDSNGNTYRVIEKDNPVYVTDTSRNGYSLVETFHKDNPSIRLSDVLGGYEGWLASPAVEPSYYSVSLGVFTAGDYLQLMSRQFFNSLGAEKRLSARTHPLVSLSSTLQIVGGDGSENAPWELSR